MSTIASAAESQHIERDFPNTLYERLVWEALAIAADWLVIEPGRRRSLFDTSGIVLDCKRPWLTAEGILATRYRETADRIEMLIEIRELLPALERLPPEFDKLWLFVID